MVERGLSRESPLVINEFENFCFFILEILEIHEFPSQICVYVL